MIFLPELLKASFVAIAKTTLCSLRSVDLQAIVTALSFIPIANFANVLPLQGITIIISKGILGPNISLSTTLVITFLLESFSNSSINSSALLKRVLQFKIFSLANIYKSHSKAANSFITASVFCSEQKDPVNPIPIFLFLSILINCPFNCFIKRFCTTIIGILSRKLL